MHASVGVMMLAAACSMAVPAAAQDSAKRNDKQKDKGWKLNAVSAAIPGKLAVKLRAKIEDDHLICRDKNSAVLEIPLKTITEISRDSEKDYPVSRWLMAAATHPSSERHRIGSKQYREDLEARLGLSLFAMFATLFPSHKEVVWLSWTDEAGAHDAEFHLGHTEGQALLAELKKQTGREPRDLEKERKAEEKRLKALRRGKTANPAAQEH